MSEEIANVFNGIESSDILAGKLHKYKKRV